MPDRNHGDDAYFDETLMSERDPDVWHPCHAREPKNMGMRNDEATEGTRNHILRALEVLEQRGDGSRPRAGKALADYIREYVKDVPIDELLPTVRCAMTNLRTALASFSEEFKGITS